MELVGSFLMQKRLILGPLSSLNPVHVLYWKYMHVDDSCCDMPIPRICRVVMFTCWVELGLIGSIRKKT